MAKQKKILKEARKRRQRSFHPAVSTLAKADRELVVLQTLASHHYGIPMTHYERQADTFMASAPFKEGDLRALALISEVPGSGDEEDARCGLRMSYYVPGKGLPCAILTFSRHLHSPIWLLEVRRLVKSPPVDSATQHVLRRLQADFDNPQLIREDDVFKLQSRILKDYHETVLIPRQAKKA